MAARLFFVTGKGGVGKTTVAAALALGIAAAGRRVLAVEMAADGTLARRLGAEQFATDPTPLGARLHGVRIESRALVESYFRRLLRLPFLSRRLFASSTFHAVTAAAPGVTEFLVLEQLASWTEPGRFSGRTAFDDVVIDGPASGHALRLLRTPRQLGRLVPGGPLAGSVARLQATLGDAERTGVLLVAIPDEMAVTEAIEARAALAELGLHLLPPVLNRVWPRRFSAADVAALDRLAGDDEPLLAAARLEIGARREAERHLTRLRREFVAAPLPLRERAAAGVDGEALRDFAKSLMRGL